MLPFDASILPAELSVKLVIAFVATVALGIAIGHRRHRRRDTESRRMTSASDDQSIPRELLIPVVQNDPEHVERATVINRVSQLVVAGDWSTLADQIASWESKLAETPGGVRKHELGVETCLTGLQTLLDRAERDTLDALDLADAEVERFVQRHRAAPSDHILAILAARAHMAVGASASADFWPEDQRKDAWRRMAQHYVRAENILAPFDPVSFMSPLLGEAYYHLAMGMPDGGKRLRPVFEDWIDLDPSNPAIYALHAPMLLPCNLGSEAELKSAAQAARERTAEILDDGGYALFWLPLLDEDEDTLSLMDTQTFTNGLLDLARLSSTQAEVNWAAALLMKLRDEASADRAVIYDAALHRLVRRHLGVIYPRFWHVDLPEIRALLSEVFARLPEDHMRDAPRSLLAQSTPAAA